MTFVKDLTYILNLFGSKDVIHSYKKIHENKRVVYYEVNTDENVLIVRFFKQYNKIRLENEFRIAQALAGTRVGYTVLATGQGDFALPFKEAMVSVTVGKPGRHPVYPVRRDEIYAIGRTLALFHKTILPSLELNNSFLFVGEMRIQDRLTRVEQLPVAKELRDLLAKTTSHLDAHTMPTGVLHGDLHASNVLINTKGEVCFLDFQSSGVGLYVLDIGRSIADICRDGDVLSTSAVRSYIEGYESIRALTRNERQNLHIAIAHGAFCVALWALEANRLEMTHIFSNIGKSSSVLDD